MGHITKFRWTTEDERFARTLQAEYRRRFGRELGWSKVLRLALAKLKEDLQWDPVVGKKGKSYKAQRKELGVKRHRKRPSSS